MRVPCTVILRTPALLMRRSNSVKVGSSFGVQCRVVRQAGLAPAVTGMPTVGVLLLPAELEHGHARSGKGSGASDPSVLARLPQELSADPLDLLADTQPRVHPRPGRLPHPSHAQSHATDL